MASKIVTFVRHGESAHNIERAALHTPDNPLTKYGRKQAKSIQGILGFMDFDLIVTSPMTRATETCLLSLENHNSAKKISPYILPLVCERHSGWKCDNGSSKSVLQKRFPSLNYDTLMKEDEWWYLDEEKFSTGTSKNFAKHTEVVSKRIAKLAEWISGRKEKSIVIYGHGGIFHALLGRMFKNCEVLQVQWPPRSFPMGSSHILGNWDTASKVSKL